MSRHFAADIAILPLTLARWLIHFELDSGLTQELEMKRVRFTEHQIIGILKEHESGIPVPNLCRKHGVSNASIYKWKAKYGGEDVSEAKRLKALEDENARLKRLPADGMLDNAALKDLLGKNGTVRRRAEGIAHLQSTYEMSERRAARRVLGRCRMTMRYQTIRADDVDLRERMKAIAQERQRSGYRRLHILLWREGHEVDHKRLFRIYRKKSRVSGAAAAAILESPAPDQKWSLDFVSDIRQAPHIVVLTTDAARFVLKTMQDARSLRARWRS